MTVREHHFEVVVVVEDGEATSAYLNSELSASWPDGTVYDLDAEEWLEVTEVWDDDNAAGEYIALVLTRGAP